MADTLSPAERSKRMSLVRGKNTKPEMVVRRLVHGLGYRYRLHLKDLPGKPDMVFPSRRAVILVHGCFWHQHPDPACKLARQPKSRMQFWGRKLRSNRERDQRQLLELTPETADDLKERVQAYLDKQEFPEEPHIKFMPPGEDQSP